MNVVEGWKLLKEHRGEVLALAESYQATNVRVVGSVAVGTETASSDIDLLVDLRMSMPPGKQLLRGHWSRRQPH